MLIKGLTLHLSCWFVPAVWLVHVNCSFSSCHCILIRGRQCVPCCSPQFLSAALGLVHCIATPASPVPQPGFSTGFSVTESNDTGTISASAHHGKPISFVTYAACQLFNILYRTYCIWTAISDARGLLAKRKYSESPAQIFVRGRSFCSGSLQLNTCSSALRLKKLLSRRQIRFQWWPGICCCVVEGPKAPLSLLLCRSTAFTLISPNAVGGWSHSGESSWSSLSHIILLSQFGELALGSLRNLF